MKLTNITLVHRFLAAVGSCQGDVWLESTAGDKFNLKSPFSQYIAIGELLSSHGDELELFCSNSNDEKNFYKFFDKNPEAL